MGEGGPGEKRKNSGDAVGVGVGKMAPTGLRSRGGARGCLLELENFTNIPLSFSFLISDVLRCHVCERENNFNCAGPTNCSDRETYCSFAVVSKYLGAFRGPTGRPLRYFQELGSVFLEGG